VSNSENKVNWDVVKSLGEQYGFRAISNFFGLPEICDPSHSVLVDPEVDIQPAWKIPPKVAISTAVTGAFHSKRTNPNHPVTIEEIYNSARECCQAGAPIVHIHVRNDMGYNALDPDLFHKVIDPLRAEFPNTVFDGCLVPDDQAAWERMQVVLKDKLLDVTPINTVATFCGDTLFTKPPHVMIEKTRLCQEHGVKPQIAIYSDGDVDNAARYLIKSGLLEDPLHFIILPALPGCSPMPNETAMVENLLHLRNRILDVAPEAVIMVCAAGRASSYLATLSMLLGLNIRVGMEDTVWKWPHKDDKIENNAEQFLMYKQMAGMLGREVTTPNEYRQMIGLPVK
jgi:3-keto-5-aminohexanoate cleavage enzyme